MPPSKPTKVYQDDFSPARGNALQAAVASIFGLTLQQVPNFIESPIGYEAAIARFYRQHEAEDGECWKVHLAGTLNENDDDRCRWSYRAAKEVIYLESPKDEEEMKQRINNSVIEGTKDRLEEHNNIMDPDNHPTKEEESAELSDATEKTIVKERSDRTSKGPQKIPEKFNDEICILRGKSPRGDFGHAVVAKHVADGKFDVMHDPHPDGTFLDDASEACGWCLFFV